MITLGDPTRNRKKECFPTRFLCTRLLWGSYTSMLDPITQLTLWQALRAHAERHNLGVLVISHDTALLKRLCHQRWHLAGGQLTAGTALEAP